MNIILNDVPTDIAAGTADTSGTAAAASATAVTVADAVAHALGSLPDGGTAVAVEGAVIPRSLWAETTLAAHARVDILSAVQGG